MATATKAMKGFKVTCPFCGCGDEDTTLGLNLNDLTALSCSSCDEEFSPKMAVAKVAEQLERWQAVARWVELAAEAFGSE